MRKLLLLSLMAATAIPSMASAQSQGEIRRDREEVREQREDLRDAKRYGNRGDVREERRDVREARQELREDRRDRNRSVYRAPYRDWRYNQVSIGYQLRPAFYGTRYHVTNTRYYGLRPATRNQRWIRYGDDLLLVNVRNGRVLQVIRNRY